MALVDHGPAPVSERIIEAGGAPLAVVRDGDWPEPVIAVAVHAGHDLRPGLEPRFALTAEERLREEDPFTEATVPEGMRLVRVLRSRFEVDLNRPRFRAVYQGPKDAWDLDVWQGELPDAEDRVSRAVYDAFYAAMFDELSRLAERSERFLVLDIHSYNHRREGPSAIPADPAENPEINVGTRRLDRERWAPVVEAFTGGMSSAGFDVRENVKFGGGHFAHWVSDTFPEQGCAIAIEFKKTYMDEWTGAADEAAVRRIREAMCGLRAPLGEALARVR